ncbi:hypothetical protein LCGC14_2447450 [marine sediment metagenome]|uniref:Uncharacterized protein n=1 Tax=marine sediment metagenome TaxID=412755 RepID=A0A0F9DUA6_9ZZZZ
MSVQVDKAEWLSFEDVRRELNRPDLSDEQLLQMSKDLGIKIKNFQEISPGFVTEEAS